MVAFCLNPANFISREFPASVPDSGTGPLPRLPVHVARLLQQLALAEIHLASSGSQHPGRPRATTRIAVVAHCDTGDVRKTDQPTC